jgi:magnesium chelatase subunit I
LAEVVTQFIVIKNKADKYLWMEFILHGLSEYSLISKKSIQSGVQFSDMISGMMNLDFEDDDLD